MQAERQAQQQQPPQQLQQYHCSNQQSNDVLEDIIPAHFSLILYL